MEEYKITLAAIVGPTASGKTKLGVETAKAFDGEVVSCDSMQIYSGLSISTAKPKESETQGIPHHLIGFAPCTGVFSVSEYCSLASGVIADINSRGKLPMLVGGTGLYYSSLVDNISFIEEKTDFDYRESLKKRAGSEGAGVILEELRSVDPEAASKLHPNNLGRIIRALEIYHSTGKTKTEQERLSRLNPSPYHLIAAGLDCRDREYLYDRINRRVDMMIEEGLVEEARAFFEANPSGTAVQAIGCKELLPYFNGEDSLENCVENIKMQTRRYAKRQLTWFRRDERIKFFYIDEYSDYGGLAAAVTGYIKETLNEIR